MTKLNINKLKIAACEQTELNDFGEGIFLEGLQKTVSYTHLTLPTILRV